MRTKIKATAIYCDGPFPDADQYGDEMPTWFVWMEDDAGNSSRHDICYSYDAAVELFEYLARLHPGLERVFEATTA